MVVLVVDDDPENLNMLVDMVVAMGFEVVMETVAQQVLLAVRQHQPDVIVLDMALNQALDGMDLVRMVRSDPDCSDVRIIAITADVFHYQEEQVLAGGCDVYLAKPFHFGDFQRLFRFPKT